MFKQTILYYFYPPFIPHIDENNNTILSRYIYVDPFKMSNGEYAISFNVEEKCQMNINESQMTFFRIIHTDVILVNDLPETMHLLVISLADNQVFGVTAEIFVKTLFMDMCVSNKNITWVEKYFSTWKNEVDSKKNKVLSELLELQRKIRDGQIND